MEVVYHPKQNYMEIKKEGVETEEVDKTTNQNAPTDEKKTEEETPEEEVVTLSKKELETLQKKAEDFEKSVELKRLAKLEKKEVPENKDELSARLEKMEQEILAQKANTFNSNLTEAYRSFVSDNPWANDDAKFDKIKENFNSVGTETKEELQTKMKLAAQAAFPDEYEKHLEDKIKADLFKDKAITNSNGTAASATNLHKDVKEKTDEDKMKERMASLFNQNFKLRR